MTFHQTWLGVMMYQGNLLILHKKKSTFYGQFEEDWFIWWKLKYVMQCRCLFLIFLSPERIFRIPRSLSLPCSPTPHVKACGKTAIPLCIWQWSFTSPPLFPSSHCPLGSSANFNLLTYFLLPLFDIDTYVVGWELECCALTIKFFISSPSLKSSFHLSAWKLGHWS